MLIDALPTKEVLRQHLNLMDVNCVICRNAVELALHLFKDLLEQPELLSLLASGDGDLICGHVAV